MFSLTFKAPVPIREHFKQSLLGLWAWGERCFCLEGTGEGHGGKCALLFLARPSDAHLEKKGEAGLGVAVVNKPLLPRASVGFPLSGSPGTGFPNLVHTLSTHRVCV
jgi:hypothetical protein